MSLMAVVETLDSVPEEFHSLYSERDGRFEVTAIEGMKTQGDVDRLQEALRKERGISGDLKTRVSSFGEITPESVETLQHENEDLKLQLDAASREGGPSEEDLEKLAETRALMRIRPLERQLNKATEELQAITGERDTLAKERSRSQIVTAAERAAQAKDVAVTKEVVASGDLGDWAARVFEIVDGKVVTKDGVGLTPGITPDQALLDMKEGGQRPYWFGATTGAGARGGKTPHGETGDNPFKLDEATGRPKNLTAAAQIARSDPERAKRLLSVAGKGSEAFFPHLKTD